MRDFAWKRSGKKDQEPAAPFKPSEKTTQFERERMYESYIIKNWAWSEASLDGFPESISNREQPMQVSLLGQVYILLFFFLSGTIKNLIFCLNRSIQR